MFANSRKKLFLSFMLPLVAAIFSRVLVYSDWLSTPFRAYHRIQLDMMTNFQSLGEFVRHHGEISFFKLIMMWVYPSHDALIAVQMLLGIILTMLVVYAALRLSGSRATACIAGLIYGLYSPVIYYETLALKETVFSFFCFLAIPLILYARKKHFAGIWPAICGFALFSLIMSRLSSIPWIIAAAFWIFLYVFIRNRRKTKSIKSAFVEGGRIIFLRFIPGGLIALALIFSLNYLWSGTVPSLGIESALDYNLRFGAIDAPVNLNASEEERAAGGENFRDYRKVLNVYANKALLIFRAYEIPNNTNYYFVREHLGALKYFIEPSLLIPAAMAGLIIMLITVKRRYSILVLYVAAFAIPMCMFYPLGRYRLVLIPVFAMSAAFMCTFAYWEMQKFIRGGRMKYFVLSLVIYAACAYWGIPRQIILRSEDFVAYGQALRIQDSRSDAPLTYFRFGFEINPGSRSALMNLSSELLRLAKFKEAAKLLEPYYTAEPSDTKLAMNYASALIGINEALKALDIINGIEPLDNSVSEYNRLYYKAEALKRSGQRAEAVKFYREAMKKTGDPELCKYLEALIAEISR